MILSQWKEFLSLATLAFTFHNYFDTLHKIEEERNKLNITGQFRQDLFIFNRVPKVGSSTINHLIGELRSRNNFTAYTDLDDIPVVPGYEYTFISNPFYRKKTIEVLSKTEGAYLKHQNFLNFSEFDQKLQNPIYINFVRDPVERIVSWYYYKRSFFHQIQKDFFTNQTLFLPKISIKQLKMKMEDCVMSGNTECRYNPDTSTQADHRSQMSFFCGHDLDCDKFNGETMLQKAIRNVDKSFAVVGLLESLEESLAVLEHYIPKFFKGVTELYSNGNFEENKNPLKPNISDDLRVLLAKNFSREIEFYNFCKQRLFKQYNALYL